MLCANVTICKLTAWNMHKMHKKHEAHPEGEIVHCLSPIGHHLHYLPEDTLSIMALIFDNGNYA